MQHSPKELNLCIDIYDEVGVGGGASGVSGGLLHPYSPKGSHQLLWIFYFLPLPCLRCVLFDVQGNVICLICILQLSFFGRVLSVGKRV